MRAESQTAKQPECARNRKQDSTENVGRISIKDPAGMWELNWGDSPRNESGSGNVMMND